MPHFPKQLPKTTSLSPFALTMQVLLSVFVTRPAVWSPLLNFVQEFVAMTIM